jgi:hypothetical protein
MGRVAGMRNESNTSEQVPEADMGLLALRLGLDDLQPARSGDHAGPIRPPQVLQLTLVDRHALDDEIDPGDLVEQD